MQNWILILTVTNSDGQFVSERTKKVKNKKNLIRPDEFTLQKIKIFIMKNSSSK